MRIADRSAHLHFVPFNLVAPEKMVLTPEQRNISERANAAVREVMEDHVKPLQIPFTPTCSEPEGFLAECNAYLTQLQQDSIPAQRSLNEHVDEAISRSTGEPYKRSGPKTIARMDQKYPFKLEEYLVEYPGKLAEYLLTYSEELRGNLDIAASSIVYETIDELYTGLNAVLDVISEDPNASLVRFKDRFEKPCFSGLRDMLLNVKIGDPCN